MTVDTAQVRRLVMCMRIEPQRIVLVPLEYACLHLIVLEGGLRHPKGLQSYGVALFIPSSRNIRIFS